MTTKPRIPDDTHPKPPPPPVDLLEALLQSLRPPNDKPARTRTEENA